MSSTRCWYVQLYFFSYSLQPVHLLGESCTSSADCGDTECCVAEDRRMRRFLFGPSKGTCHARRYQGQTCHVFLIHDFGNPNMYMNYCPCEEGLTCRGETVDIHGSQHVHHNPKCIPADQTTTTQAQNSPSSTGPSTGEVTLIGWCYCINSNCDSELFRKWTS